MARVRVTVGEWQEQEVVKLTEALLQLDDTIQQSLRYMETPNQGLSKRSTVASLASIKEEVPRHQKMTIYCRVVFLKLGEIDTVNEKFSADVFLQARWREPSMDGQDTDVEYEQKEWASLWNPKLFVENVMSDMKESVWYIVSFNKKGEAMISQRRRVKGTFFERMELMQYPFDTQDLTVTLTTERGEHEVELEADESEVSSVNVQSFVDEQEWHLHKHINTQQKVTTNVYKSARHKHPAISISCTATRRSRFFIWNIILVMIFISTLVFTTFAVDQTKPQNRLQLSFILLLSNITFKFTVNQTLPKVSYLTYLDKYILLSMAILCLVCIWHALAGQLNNWMDAHQAFLVDIYAFCIFAFSYIAFNLTFFAWSKCLVSKRWKEYNRKDQTHRMKVQAMEQSKNAATKINIHPMSV